MSVDGGGLCTSCISSLYTLYHLLPRIRGFADLTVATMLLIRAAIVVASTLLAFANAQDYTWYACLNSSIL